MLLTVSKSIERISNGTDFYISLGDFLDEFYRSDKAMRQIMINDEPLEFANVQKEYLALFAATSHKLANDYELRIPTWVMSPKYSMLDKPFFDCGAKGNLRLLFMYKSPLEFKHKNLFVDENFLVRV